MSRISSLLTAALCAAAVVQAGLAPCPGAEPTSAEKKIEEEAGTEACMSTKVYPVDDLIARHVPGSAEEDQDESADFDSMIEMITSTVDPATWGDAGGPGSIAPITTGGVESLTVLQTHHTHRKIAALLQELRDVAERKRQADAAKQRPTLAVYWHRSCNAKKIEKIYPVVSCLHTERGIADFHEDLQCIRHLWGFQD